jgi:heptosyltransferase-1
MPPNYNNILIIKPSSLGDIIMALPALSALHRSFPDAKISWLVRSEFSPLLKNHPHLTSIIPFERKHLGKSLHSPAAMRSLKSFLRQLQRSEFDIVFDFQGLFRTAFFAWVTGCKKRFGMASAREFAHLFYTDKIAQNQESIHLVDYYLKMIQAAGAGDVGVEFVLPKAPEASDSVDKLLKSHGIERDNYAVFVTGSAHEDKCWPIERFAALAEKVSSQFDLSIVTTGSVSEGDTIERLKSIAGVPITNLAGHTNLSELIALLDRAKLVVSNDTGPGHIAAALGRPMVLIFGRSNPARVAPYGRAECVAAVEPFDRGFKADSNDPRHNIKSVTLDEVFQRVCEQLGNLPDCHYNS